MRLSHHDDFERMGVHAVEAALIADLLAPGPRSQARLWLACRPDRLPSGRATHSRTSGTTAVWMTGLLQCASTMLAAVFGRPPS